MNIFALDKNPKQASIYHTDKHVVKMPLETAQMLCTVMSKNNIQSIYKPTHANHPCTIWAGESIENYFWLCELGIELCNEYQFRYKKVHACLDVIVDCIVKAPEIESKGLISFALAMPVDCKIKNNPVECYHEYYNKYKSHLFSWKQRQTPYFINQTSNI